MIDESTHRGEDIKYDLVDVMEIRDRCLHHPKAHEQDTAKVVTMYPLINDPYVRLVVGSIVVRSE